MDIKRFCSGRIIPQLENPFNYGGYTFASDGHIIVRVPLLPDVEDIASDRISMDIFNFDNDKWETKFPEYEPQKMKTCPACDGTKRSSFCPECDGEGFVGIDNGFNEYECDCKTCNGSGSVSGGDEKCSFCEGTGEVYVDRFPHVDIGDVRLNIKLLDKIKDLPGIVLGTVDGESRMMVNFRFDGGDGIMMVMQKW